MDIMDSTNTLLAEFDELFISDSSTNMTQIVQ